MNWKNTYNLSIGVIIISLLLIIRNIYSFRFGFNIIRNIIPIAGLIVFFNFIRILNRSIKNNQIDKNLKVFEYISYAYVVYKAFFLILSCVTFVKYPQLLGEYLYIGVFILKILMVFLVFNTFSIRKKILGSYNVKSTIEENISDIGSFKTTTYNSIEERISLCKRCLNKSFDPKIGLICGLSNAKPEFNSFCTDFLINEKEHKKMNQDVAVKKTGFFGSWKAALLMSFLGFVRAGMRGFEDPFGIIFLVLGVGWLIIALSSNNNK